MSWSLNFFSFWFFAEGLLHLNKKIKNKNKKYKSLILIWNACKKHLSKNFFYMGDTLKKGFFSTIMHFLNLKIFILPKFHSPMWWNGWNINLKKRKNKQKKKKEKNAVKKGKNANLKKTVFIIFQVGPMLCLSFKFHAALMFDGWGNREQTHHFFVCVWKRKMP